MVTKIKNSTVGNISIPLSERVEIIDRSFKKTRRDIFTMGFYFSQKIRQNTSCLVSSLYRPLFIESLLVENENVL